MEQKHKLPSILIILISSILSLPCAAMGEELPAWYVTTTNLNLRRSDNTYSAKITTLPANTEIMVDYFTDNGWAAVNYYKQRGYVSSRYIRYTRPVQQTSISTETEPAVGKKKSSGWFGWIFILVFWVIGFLILRAVAKYALGIWSLIMYRTYWIVCIPFYVSNWLQRFLSKPWRIFYKSNNGRDYHNSELRENL